MLILQNVHNYIFKRNYRFLWLKILKNVVISLLGSPIQKKAKQLVIQLFLEALFIRFWFRLQ